MTQLKVYNTLSGKKEVFQPINDLVRIYSCGPTVYKYAHIGNLRTYIFMDLLVRVLRYDGYKVKNVMNITDVGHLLSDADEGEDKMERSARERNTDPYEIAREVTERFFRDTDSLNIVRPTVTPRATDNIREMIDIVSALCEKGYAYEIDDGIYYDVSKFPDYGKLSGNILEEQQAGARVEVNDQKRHPADFALWKKAQPNHIMQWDSPWGRGFPGWHIECTAMSLKYLGKTFDIHTGGVDHIPVHHENEIAQSEALVGHKTVDYWMHVEFMQVDGGKMSKSLKNTYTVSELEQKGYSAMAFRYFCLNTHYRKKLNFTFEGMDAAKTAYNRLLAAVHSHKGGKSFDEEAVKKYDELFTEAINDDINIPLGLGVLWNMLKEKPSQAIYDLAMKFDKVLGLALDTESAPEKVEAPEEVIKLAELRLKARKDKDWAQSDVLREQISKLGYQIIDKKDGYDIKKI